MKQEDTTIEQFPMALSAADHTHRVYGAIELADGRLLSWSVDHTLRLWSAQGKPIVIMSAKQDIDTPNGLIDLSTDLSLVIARGISLVYVYGAAAQQARCLRLDNNGKLKNVGRKAQPEAAKAAKTVARTICRYLSDNATVYLSVRTEWAASVLQHLPQETLHTIDALQITSTQAYEAAGAVLPDLSLDLLQLTEMPGVQALDELYGIQAKRLFLFACNDLVSVAGQNCVVETVEHSSCPRLGDIQVSGPLGEAEVIARECT